MHVVLMPHNRVRVVAAAIGPGPVRVRPALRAEVAAGMAAVAECTMAAAVACTLAAVEVAECIAVVGVEVAAATPQPLAAQAEHTGANQLIANAVSAEIRAGSVFLRRSGA
jgi:hypothetical protein